MMNTICAPEFARSYGFFSEPEQQRLIQTNIAVGGAGGDGFQLVLKLARMGIGSFSVADPEVFEPENINRVPGATRPTLGRNKAEVLQEMVAEINPDAKVRIFTEGVQEENVEEFMLGADLVFDESELTHLEIGTLIARQARKQGIPDLLVMNVAFAALMTAFSPKPGKKTFEGVMGIPNGAPLDEVSEMKVDFSRILPYVPSYVDLDSFLAVQGDNPASLPSIAPGVDLASGLGSTQAFLHLVSDIGNNRPEPVWAPQFKWIDAYTVQGGQTRLPRFSHYRHLAFMLLRNKLGLNPKASYSQQERLARGQ